MKEFRRLIIICIALWLYMPFNLFTQTSDLPSDQRGVRVLAKDNQTGQEKIVNLYKKVYGVIIGIDLYINLPPDRQLRYAVKDAKGIEKLLRERFVFDEIITLYNKEASLGGIMSTLLGKLSQTGPDDAVFIFFAGHGYTETTRYGELGYLVPYDGSFEKGELYKNISMTELKENVGKAIPARHVFFMVDACFSGLLVVTRGNTPGKSRDLNYIQKITKEPVRQILTAGGQDEKVLDKGPFGHSVFVGRILQILDETSDFITASELSVKVKEKVFSDAQDMGHSQTPAFGTFLGLGDFVFIKRKHGTHPPTEADNLSRSEAEETFPFRFPSLIKYKILKKGKQLGSCRFEYEPLGKLEKTSSLKLTNFQGMGYKENNWLLTYFYCKDKSIYANFLVRGKEPISEMRLKDMRSFDGTMRKGFVYKSIDSPEVLKREIFSENKIVDLLTLFLVTSERIASGKYKTNIKFDFLFDKDTRVIEMRYFGEEKVPFQGKEVSCRSLSVNYKNTEIFRFKIFKDNAGNFFPASINFMDQSQGPFELRADDTMHATFEVFITNLSFMDALTRTRMANTDLTKMINEAVLSGMNMAKKNYEMNKPCGDIPNTDENVEKLANIVFDPNLTPNEKINKIIDDLMAPNNIDIIVTGHYVDNAQDPKIEIRPLIIIRSSKKAILKNLQFTKGELLCKDIDGSKSKLCRGVFDQIAQAVMELIEEL